IESDDLRQLELTEVLDRLRRDGDLFDLEAPDKLARYRSKRSRGATPEPVPDVAADSERTGSAGSASGAKSTGPASGRSFVIHEHHARQLHWDFRLERDGVLVSWALPKGLPRDPKQNRLAVRTEDHP